MGAGSQHEEADDDEADGEDDAEAMRADAQVAGKDEDADDDEGDRQHPAVPPGPYPPFPDRAPVALLRQHLEAIIHR